MRIGYSIPRMTEVSFKVLRALADGEFHSGVVIAHELGMSRGTVWNAVRAIDAAGVRVYKVHGRGYKLQRPLSLLNSDAILRAAGQQALPFAIDIVDVAES